jgi:hypothetical protein
VHEEAAEWMDFGCMTQEQQGDGVEQGDNDRARS